MSTWSDYSMGDDSESPYLHRNLWAAWMPMFGATGSTLFDASGRSFHADANNKTNATDWVVQGGISAAYSQYSNATGRFIAPALSTLAGQREATLSCWVWLVSTPTITSAIYQDTATGLTGARFGLLWTNGGNIQFQMRDPYTQRSLAPLSTTTTTETYGRWSHWAAVYSAGAATHAIYRDGQLVRTGSNTGDQIRSASVYSIGIGGRISSSAEEVSCDMYLAELRLWNRALSSEEVRELGATPGAGCRRRSRVFRVASLAGDAVTGSSSSTTASASSTGSGLLEFQGIATASTQDAASTCAGSVGTAGSGSSNTEGCSSSASGLVAVEGASSASTASASGSSAGVVSLVGTSAATTTSASSAGSGVVGVAGSSSVQLDGASSQCVAVQVVEGAGASSTSCQASSAGTVALVGSSSAVTDDAVSSASGFNGIQGAGAASTDAVSSASGVVSLVGLAVLTTADAVSSASGQIPLQGSAAVQLGSAVSVAVGLVLQTDVELAGAVEVAQCDGKVSAPWLVGRVREDRLEGRKVWP